jgi:hypothetical protein
MMDCGIIRQAQFRSSEFVVVASATFRVNYNTGVDQQGPLLTQDRISIQLSVRQP